MMLHFESFLAKLANKSPFITMNGINMPIQMRSSLVCILTLKTLKQSSVFVLFVEFDDTISTNVDSILKIFKCVSDFVSASSFLDCIVYSMCMSIDLGSFLVCVLTMRAFVNSLLNSFIHIVMFVHCYDTILIDNDTLFKLFSRTRRCICVAIVIIQIIVII